MGTGPRRHTAPQRYPAMPRPAMPAALPRTRRRWFASARPRRGLTGWRSGSSRRRAGRDLVLPPALAQLRQLAACRRFGPKVLDDWGFRAQSARGLALTALFSGLPAPARPWRPRSRQRSVRGRRRAGALPRVDLAALVSKYNGETQKNIGRIFDAAGEASGAVLLFDEGEALFARRSTEVRTATTATPIPDLVSAATALRAMAVSPLSPPTCAPPWTTPSCAVSAR